MKSLDYEKLESELANNQERFLSASPFSHIVIDNFLTTEAADNLISEFGDDRNWSHYNHYNEQKMGFTEFNELSNEAQEIIRELSSERFLRWLAQLSGIDGLLADPDLDGGGLHCIGQNGFLNIHADFQSHTKRPHWSRQLNLLLYLNRDWRDDWGGHLELWDPKVIKAERTISPDFNRCVIFQTTADAMHGHPTPLACPADQSRKSLALYYFKDEFSTQRLQPTNYRARPSDSAIKRILIDADRWLVRSYSFLKRYTPLGDRIVSRILKRYSR
jgi:Rps23 Pro-64 3,4-dihydroxylase Tpa1-like proline 4-hydroxylase